MASYLDENGLLYIKTKLEEKFEQKVDKVDGKGLSTEDFTSSEKANYDAAYTHSKAPHAPSSAQANVIETVKVNGVAQGVVSKAVDIQVPTAVSSLPDAGDYAKKTDLANVYIYQGSVANTSDLPATAVPGYVYNVETDGMNYAWNGSKWDTLGAVFNIASISNAEIDSLFAS